MFLEFLGKVFVDYGPSVGIFVVFVILLRWVLKQQEGIVEQAKEERESWRKTIDKINDTLQQRMDAGREFHHTVKEDHKQVRKEHNKILDGLTEITRSLRLMNNR